MAHNLNINNGTASFFTVKKKAWHELGLVLDNCPTSADAIRFAQLDWEVEKQQLYCTTEHGRLPIPNKFVTYRNDNGKPFGIVGKNYTLVQNIEAFKFFDEIVGQGEAIYETAGCLYNGQQVFISAKLPDYIKVGNDCVEKYLLLYNSHDGKSALRVLFTPVRVVCNNTLMMALNTAHRAVSLTHGTSVNHNLKNVHKVLGIAKSTFAQIEELGNKFLETQIDDNWFKRFSHLLFFDSDEVKYIYEDPESDARMLVRRTNSIVSGQRRNTVAAFNHYAKYGPGQAENKNLWGAYNAVTGYLQNSKSFSSFETKLEAVTNSTIIDKALQLCMNPKTVFQQTNFN